MLAVHNFDAETIARPVLLADNVTLLTRPGVALRLAKWTPRSFVLNIPGDSRFHTHEDKFTFARTVTVSRVQAVRDALQWSQQVWVACSSSKHDWPANLRNKGEAEAPVRSRCGQASNLVQAPLTSVCP